MSERRMKGISALETTLLDRNLVILSFIHLKNMPEKRMKGTSALETTLLDRNLMILSFIHLKKCQKGE